MGDIFCTCFIAGSMEEKCQGAQGLSQDFETGCLKLAIVKLKGAHNMLRFQTSTCINLSK